MKKKYLWYTDTHLDKVNSAKYYGKPRNEEHIFI